MKPKNILTEDVLQAYNELGGIDYLRSQPALLQRILLKIANTPDPNPTIIIDMSTYAPWMDWRQRLSYKRDLAKDSVTDIEHRALPDEPGALPDALARNPVTAPPERVAQSTMSDAGELRALPDAGELRALPDALARNPVTAPPTNWREPTPMPLVELKKPVPTKDAGARDIVIDN